MLEEKHRNQNADKRNGGMETLTELHNTNLLQQERNHGNIPDYDRSWGESWPTGPSCSTLLNRSSDAEDTYVLNGDNTYGGCKRDTITSALSNEINYLCINKKHMRQHQHDQCVLALPASGKHDTTCQYYWLRRDFLTTRDSSHFWGR